MKDIYVIYNNFYCENRIPGWVKSGLLIPITYSDGMG